MLVNVLSYLIWIGLVFGGMVFVFRFLGLARPRRAPVRVRASQKREN